MTTSTAPKLIDDIDRFLSATGMGPSYFGKCAAGQSELVSRLRAGKRCWPETEAKVREFMARYLKTLEKAA